MVTNMNPFGKAMTIFFFTLLTLLTIAPSKTSENTSLSVRSSGIINYPGVIAVDFESDDCFKMGINGQPRYMLYGTEYSGTAPYWTHGGWGPYENPTTTLFEPQTAISYSGQSAKLSVLSTTESGRRLEILHNVDPYSEHLWNIVYWYIPSDLEPFDSHLCIQRLIYERYWTGGSPSLYSFQISISVATDGRSMTNGQQHLRLNLGKGDVDNDEDGYVDVYPFRGGELYSNGDGNQAGMPESWMNKKTLLVPFDTWFPIEVYVFRNVTDYNNGIIRVWINNDLIWDVQGTRTIGISPEILSRYEQKPPAPYAFLCSGFGLYTGLGSSPKTIYADNVVLSNTESHP